MLEITLSRARSNADARRDWRWLLVGLVALDAAMLVVAVGGASLIRLWAGETLPVSQLAIARHVIASILVLPVLLVLFRVQGLYDFDHILAGTREYARIVYAASYGVMIALAASYFAGGEPAISRSWLVLVWLLSIGCVGVGRFVIRRVVRRLRRGGALRTRVAIVGASTFGVAIAEQLQAAKDEGLDVVGFLDEYVPLGQRLLGDLAVVGRPGDLLDALALDLAEEYILIPQALPHERFEEITRLTVSRDRPTVRLAVSTSDLLTNGVLVAERGSVPLVTLRRARIVGIDAVLKRGLDLAGAVIGLILLAPPVLAMLARARVAGVRPLFRGQPIYVADGRKTTLWLFDPGVSTWLPVRGAPALFAVLRGQLSLVGPRPIIYEGNHSEPSALSLTGVKPGITGPWRLSGPTASLADQTMQDLTYVRNYTIWEDVRILWQSVWRVRYENGVARLGRWQQRSTGLEHVRPGVGETSELSGAPQPRM